MPYIKPIAGDTIEVIVKGRNGSPVALVAEIGNLDHSDKLDILNVLLDGTPPFQGCVDIKNYTWSHEQSRWRLNGPTRPVPQEEPLGLADTTDDLEIKRPATIAK